ncbi:MAG: NADH-quinone oxidoreductase subunit M [Gammaproteobacteria bacterium]|nr:NADH-quinone oxidoreductase subunit M [Gammaproteobacteria bacterium]
MSIIELHWSLHAGLPLLSVLQLLPLLGALLMLALRTWPHLARLGLLLATVELLLAVKLYLDYDPTSPAMQFAEWWHLFGPLDYHAAVDGVSVLFILLSALTSLLVMVYGPIRGLGPTWQLMALVFAVESTLMMMFSTLNLMWFVVLSAVQLGLIGDVLGRWATSPARDTALVRYYQFMGAGILLMLIGALLLGWGHAQDGGRHWAFDLAELARVPVAPASQAVVFFLLFYGLAIRTPLFPFHGWLPPVAEHGDIAVAPTLLLGLKVGVYGLLRFVFPLLPEAVQAWQSYVFAFAVVGIFYAALMAMLQENLRRLLAFAVVSHTSILVLGLFSLDHRAFQGSVMLSVTFGLALVTLVFMTGLMFRRAGTSLLAKLGGLFDQMPLVGIAFLVAGLSIVGMPGTPGFDAAHLVLEASVQRFGGLLTVAAALGNVLAAGFLLWAFQRAFLAPARVPNAMAGGPGVTTPERVIAGVLVVVMLGAGFYTEPWLNLIDLPLEQLSSFYSGATGNR